ncbi:MAG: universal stress protein [Pseudomonadota bacterium]
MKILLPVDGSEPSLHAARLVAAYRGDARRLAPVLLNVQPPPLTVWPNAGVDRVSLEEALFAEGAKCLEPARSILRQAGFEPECHVRLGHAAETIVDATREWQTDAVVMGTRGHGPLGGFALGSVALRVAPSARCPVALVKPDTRLPESLGRRLRVVVPLDGSQAATQAALRVVQCAGPLGVEQVDLVHFQPTLTFLEAVMPPHGDVLQHWSGREAEDAVASARQALADAGIAHQVHKLSGEPAAGIAQFALERGADLIAMATRGIGTIRHLLVGSVALKTAHLSHVPVAFMR